MKKPPDSKLLKIKKWLTLPEAAKHLSGICGEEVTEANILRFAIDGYLKLSVHFVNHAKARIGRIVGYEEVEWREWSGQLGPIPNLSDEEKGKPIMIMSSLEIDDERFINLREEVVTIRDVWDLPMIGAEWLDIEHEYQTLTGGPEVKLQCLEGAFVERDDEICQLQERFDDNEFYTGSPLKDKTKSGLKAQLQ